MSEATHTLRQERPELVVTPSPLAHHFENLDQQRDAESLGMWVYIATEVLIFAGLFTGYFAYRIWYQKDFEAASARLNVLIGGLNTVVLLTSSLTMALSVYAARVNNQRLLCTCLGLTCLLGLSFLGFKAVEYTGDYRENLVPGSAYFKPEDWAREGFDPAHVQLFLTFYYILTGIHATHMAAGIGWIAVIIVLAWRGRFSPLHYMPIEILALYWHFVDIVWIFLLPLLYLTGEHHVSDLHFLK